MNGKKTVSVFFSITLLGACALSSSVALAEQAGLALHGQMVNAGCDARLPQGHDVAPTARSLPVKAGLALQLVGRDDACRGTAMPVAARYVERSSMRTGPHTGVVTVTYQ